jgi:hypothetical protein
MKTNEIIDLFIELHDFITSNKHLTMSQQWTLWCGLKGLRIDCNNYHSMMFKRVWEFINEDYKV